MANASALFRVAVIDRFTDLAGYIGFCTSDPGDGTGASTEITTTDWPSYARQAIPAMNAWSAPVTLSTGEKETENLAQYNFPQQDGAALVTLTYIGVWSAATGGNLIISAPLAMPKTIAPGDGIAISPGGLRFRVD